MTNGTHSTLELNNGTNHRADHHFIKGVIRWINKVITFLEAVALFALLIFGVYGIWDNKQIDNENTASEYEMYKPTAVDTRVYDDFKAVNPDVCGWLTIDDTGIDYPLVQGEDNDEYMNKTPDLKFALSGSLFLDYTNSNDFSDFNTIIYGHHMEGPSMFGALDQYVSAAFFDSHRTGLLYFNNEWHELDIFAFLEVDAYDSEIYSFAKSIDEQEGYLDYIKNTALQYNDIGVSTSDHIIIMSTCMTDKTNGRYIAVAKIGAVTDGPQEQTTGRILSRDGLSPQTWSMIFAGIGFGIIFLVILVYLLVKRHKRKKADRAARAAQAAWRASYSAAYREEQQSVGRDGRNVLTDDQGIGSEEQKAETDDQRSEAGETGVNTAVSGEEQGQEKAVSGEEQAQRKGSHSKKSDGKKRKKRTVLSDLIDLLIRIGIIVAIVYVVFTFIFGLFVNSGVAMEPSVQDRDIIIFYRLDNEYTANEAVVYEADGEERLGRIVARGGDTVEITDEGLKVNGYLQQDYKNVGETLAVKGGPEYPITLAEDEFFILGDNREESTDSRMFGPVKLDDVKGSVMTVLRRRDV